jgi:hypothetical protein
MKISINIFSRLTLVASVCTLVASTPVNAAEVMTSAAATPKHRLSHRTVFTNRHHTVETNAPLIELKPQVPGVIPRISRGDDPLQMINPFAPGKYGTAEENTVPDPDVPGRGDGIKLLSVSF